uniref:NADH-ubiquinone oxidoreductase chain 5 n=2 Tax=Labridae TaxID=8247 RepID=A0A411GXY5_9LABR|nr:NADH dehydrogenase subunit 5 [Halichoeres nigrescens]YP_009861697.1 NADH dehydrogenase subunit 5 [Thalassoma lunare]QBB10837.1 NADH dehydrogenase subunit 5 [Halichoeres nigrescens]QKD75035.1 NADH dehydrogenase subunit 5 [Thalassoma lunare]
MPGPIYPPTSSILLVLALLLYPILDRLFPHKNSTKELATYIKTAVKLSFFISLMPLAYLLFAKPESTVNSWTLIKTESFSMTISCNFDLYALVFIPIALYVTWAILEFAIWYMSEDMNIGRFFLYLLIFLMAMMILVTANNLYQLFIGWEGVGMMSFLLIGWWHARADANTASFQAVAYNRIGDVGFLFLMAWALNGFNTWQIEEINQLALDKNAAPGLIAAIVAATGKSAQFGLHPWLPAAMEGPTPVSSLLHSSTMVVAGIFLLIRFADLLATSQLALTICLCLGAMTTFITAICALTQSDIKKIIAFSTSSQLGLMMVTIGLNQPQLAFLHICTHAFFKAMLFICAGSIIHCLNNEQDIRKMGGVYRLAPFTCACLILGSLALTGTPFLAGFFSKDAIIEATTTSDLNACALLITLAATGMTAAYSLRIIFYVVMGQPRINPLSPANENSPHVINPLKRLAWGSIASGLLLFSYLMPEKTPLMTMHPILKTAAMIVTLAGLLLAFELAALAAKHYKPRPKREPYLFSLLLSYFPMLIHRSIPKMSLTMGQKFASQAVDQTWLEKVGPQAVNSSNRPMISTTSNLQRGLIMTHLAMLVLSTTLGIILGCQ